MSKLYSFTNIYLSGGQKGLQTTHAAIQMSREYTPYNRFDPWSPQEVMFCDWADNHKTIIIKDGGDHNRLVEILKIFEVSSDYPYSSFAEDALRNTVTSVVAILPEKFYKRDLEAIKRDDESVYSKADKQIMILLDSTKMSVL